MRLLLNTILASGLIALWLITGTAFGCAAIGAMWKLALRELKILINDEGE